MASVDEQGSHRSQAAQQQREQQTRAKRAGDARFQSGPGVVQRMDRDLVLRYAKDQACLVDSMTFSAWDYGGQDVFYSLHTLFLTRCVFLLTTFSAHHL